MSVEALAACEATVRRVDSDRYLAALFAPARERPFLYALYAFNHELARVAETVHEPLVGQIRLQWWREALEGARAGNPRRHDVAEAMAGLFASREISLDLLAGMINAREQDLVQEPFGKLDELETYLDRTSGHLMRLAAAVLDPASNMDDLARHAGVAYGLAGLIRSGPLRRRHGLRGIGDTLKDTARMRALELHGLGRRLTRPGAAALPAFLPATLVPLYARAPSDEREVPVYRRQLAFLHAALRGRI